MQARRTFIRPTCRYGSGVGGIYRSAEGRREGHHPTVAMVGRLTIPRNLSYLRPPR
jgi:hypothetical protein